MKYLLAPEALGDRIVEVGMINYFSQQDDILIPCYEKDIVSNMAFFAGNDKVHIEPVKQNTIKEWEKNKAELYPNDLIKVYDRAGIGGRIDTSWCPLFYKSVNLPYSVRFDYGKLYEQSRKVWQFPVPTVPYIFVHNNPRYDGGSKALYPMQLPQNIHWYFAIPTEHSVLAYADVMINAVSCHFIDSSFLHLAEYFPLKGDVFYYPTNEKINYDVYRHYITRVEALEAFWDNSIWKNH